MPYMIFPCSSNFMCFNGAKVRRCIGLAPNFPTALMCAAVGYPKFTVRSEMLYTIVYSTKQTPHHAHLYVDSNYTLDTSYRIHA